MLYKKYGAVGSSSVSIDDTLIIAPSKGSASRQSVGSLSLWLQLNADLAVLMGRTVNVDI